MKVAVIGAGIAGLAASHELRKLGHQVEIYEATERAGGRGRLLNRPGTDDWADVGSQYFHTNYEFGLKLIDELGLTPKLKTIKGQTRVFTGKGQDQSYLLNPRLPWINPGGISGNLKVAWYLMRMLLKHRSHTFAADASMAAYDSQLALETTSDKFIQDHIIRMMSLIGGLSEPDSTKVNLLQIFRLVKIVMLTGYVSLKGGTATLHAELAKRVTIHYNSPVKSLVEENGRTTGLVLESGERVDADHVVMAAPATKAAELVPAEWVTEKAYLSGIEMPPAILVSLFLDRPLENDVWTYFLPFENEGSVSFCVDTHQKSPDNTPSGKATLQAWILNPKSAALIDKTDEELASIARKGIAPYLPKVDNAIEGFSVTRHHNAVPQATVGHNARTLDFLKSAQQRKGLSFCGDYMSGGYMESALWSVNHALSDFPNHEELKQAA